ncbi:MAG: ABC transporter permease [Oscillospiraceae bacterium]|nr:ABC transporter permease [Oscillospiraceae bacterium]
MKKYIGKRLLHLVGILIALSFLTFLLMYLAPGDAATKKLNAQGIAVSQEVLEQVRTEMGLDRPFLVQYGDWALKVLRGDLGNSYKDGVSVAAKLGKALGYTVELAFGSLLLSLVIALPLAILTALKQDSLLDYLLRFLSFIGNSLPNFLISVLLMYFFCVKARLLPVVAERSLKGLLLPSAALSIPMIGRFLRQFRAEILEQMSRSYVSGAASRGVKRRYILYRNVLHNASITILTIVGLQIGTLMGGSVVIETIFRWPGLGKLAMDAITARDYPVIQGFVLLTASFYVLVNLLTDIAYHWIDPRVRPE